MLPASALAPGALVGPYRVVAILGQGGFGVVYSVRDERTGRAVALKVLRSELLARTDVVARFAREARASLAVRHPNVVETIEVGEAGGTTYLASELVPGGSLADRVRARGVLGWREVARLGAGIARGLAAIHAAGLVHRDVKPANVLLDAAGSPRLADFGIVGGDGASAGLSRAGNLTRTGEIVGSYEYMAPEQADGVPVDARADLYSLGATLYELLTGTPPFPGSGYEVLRRVLTAEPRPASQLVSGVPPRLDRLVLRLLAKRPDARPGSAAAVAAELEAIARTGDRGRSRVLASVVAATVVSGAVGVPAVLFLRGRSERVAAEARQAEARGAGTRMDEARKDEARRLARSAEASLGAGRLDAALVEASRAVELDPDHAPAYHARGRARFRKGDRDGGLADLERAAHVAPRDKWSWVYLATARLRSGDVEGALAGATRGREVAPFAPEPRVLLGEIAFRAGRLEAAVDEFSRSVELGPRLGEAYAGRGAALLGLRKRREAVVDLTLAIAFSPAHVDAWTYRGQARLALDDDGGAVADATRSIELDPSRPLPYVIRAQARRARGELAGAASDAEAALALAPGNGDLWAFLGSVRVERGDGPGAVDACAKAIELAPRTPELRASDLEKAVRLAPSSPGTPGIRRFLERRGH